MAAHAELRRLPTATSGLSDVAIGVLAPLTPSHQRRRGGGVTAVYVVTAGSGESYRIDRVYLYADQAYGSVEAYNGIALVEPVQATDGMT